MSATTLLALPVVSVALSIATYALGLKLHHRWRWIPPILVAAAPIIFLLIAVHESFDAYNRGGAWLTWLLGPGTVALAIPMYRNGLALRPSLPRLMIVVSLGSMVGMASAGLTAWLCGAPRAVVVSLLPKSVTTPIAIEVCNQLGGIPSITIMVVVITGVLGGSFGVSILRVLPVNSARAIGAAIGTTSHGVGTASLIHRSEREASVSAWAMAASGIVTSIVATILKIFIH
jgi:putative effector of murein hydrolase